MTELRLSLIQTILDFYHKEVELRLRNQPACASRNYVSTTDRVLCDTVILGGMWRHWGRTKQEFPSKIATEYSRSANNLLGALAAVFFAIPSLNSHHADCNPSKKFAEFRVKTKDDKQWKDVLQEHHMERIAAQQKKTGLSDC